MRILILCGGVASRLGDIASQCPKPMLPFDGKPFLSILISRLFEAGFREYYLLTGHLAGVVEEVESHLKDYSHEIDIKYIKDGQLKGTLGALYSAYLQIGSPFAVCNGDTLFVPERALVELQSSINSAILTTSVDRDRYTVFEVMDEMGSNRKCASTGFYLFHTINERKMMELAISGQKIESYVEWEIENGLCRPRLTDQPIIDIGTVEDYHFYQTKGLGR